MSRPRRSPRPGEGLTLAVTSSTGVMGLAIGQVGPGSGNGSAGDGIELVAEVEVQTDRRHAEEIGPRLAGLLATADLSLSQLDRLVIDIGPGRFTGLRVGMATVRALAFALELPVVGLTSLAVLAASPVDGRIDRPPEAAPTEVTAVIDARRSEVFQQRFVGGVARGAPDVGPAQRLAAEARGTVIGDGVDRYPDEYRAAAAMSGAVPVPGVTLRAAAMLTLSRGEVGVAGPQVRPLYLREPDATPNIRTRVGAGQSEAGR